jgi:hypothetical protein
VAYLIKAKIVGPEETSIAWEQHGNKTLLGVFYAVRAMSQSNRDTRNNREIVGRGIFYMVRAEGI